MTTAQNQNPSSPPASLFSSCQGPESTRFLFIVSFNKMFSFLLTQKLLNPTNAGLTDPRVADVGHGRSFCGWSCSKHGQGVGPIQHGAEGVWGSGGRRGRRGGGAAFAGSTLGLCICDLKGKSKAQNPTRQITFSVNTMSWMTEEMCCRNWKWDGKVKRSRTLAKT